MEIDSASIRLKSALLEIQFHWRGFDGDDGFHDFQIHVIRNAESEQFNFGPCVVYGLRKLSKFFRDGKPDEATGGFRFPDIRMYEIQRVADAFRLFIHFEGSGLRAEFLIAGARVEIDDRLIAEDSE